MPYLNDPYLEALSHRIIRKLQNMTDEEFEWLTFWYVSKVTKSR
ncbi:MAG: transposon-transfer assisting family protein [Lachnospiraceae bacterium]|nr:transposon-transfer assisting family protein [Lachnospiraceae bacterium]